MRHDLVKTGAMKYQADISGTGSGMSENDVAIVGMAAHLPGAGSIEAYWANLRDGIESIRRLSEEELLAAGEAPMQGS